MGNFRSDDRGRERFGGSRFGGGRGGNRGGFRRDSDGPREMTRVTCSDCGKETEVPFKPRGDKPVFCSECFKKHDGGSRSGSSGASSEQFNQINAKLDKIIQTLEDLEIIADDEKEEESEEKAN